MSARRATQENRFRTIPAQQPLAFARADAAPAKAASHKCASIAPRLKEASHNRYCTSIEQHSAP